MFDRIKELLEKLAGKLGDFLAGPDLRILIPVESNNRRPAPRPGTKR